MVLFDAVDPGLPRKLSTRPDDKSFDKAAMRLSDRVDVLLDGTILPEVAAWDADKGEVIRRRRYRDGTLVLGKGGIPEHETLRGLVEVRWRKGAAE